jgi:hypothetical protein
MNDDLFRFLQSTSLDDIIIDVKKSMLNYNKKKRININPKRKKENQLGNAFSHAFAYPIITITTIVGLIVSQITHCHHRLYHKLDV